MPALRRCRWRATPACCLRSGLLIEKQVGISEEFSTNVGRSLGAGGSGGYDFITLIQPSVTILDDTQRLSVNLTYDPTVRVYARNFDYSQVQQQGSGDILGTVLPDWIFVDLRGSASQQSVYGGYGQGVQHHAGAGRPRDPDQRFCHASRHA